MRIVVFGASGFVGGWICELLNECDGIDLLACLRKWAGATRIARRGINMAQVDLDSAADLSEIVRGAEAVINAAVPPSDQEPNSALRLYTACANAGVRRFVQFSSAAVYGDLSGDVDENVPPAPADNYGRGKVDMELRLQRARASASTQLFVLRPSIIYGPYSDAWTVRFARRIVNGRWNGLGRLGTGTCNLIYAKDVARAAILCCTAEANPGSHILNINGPDVVSWNEYIRRFGDALSVENRRPPNNVKLLTMVIGAETVRKTGKWLLTRFEQPVKRITQVGRTAPAVMAGAKSLSDLYPTVNEVRLLRRKVTYTWDLAGKTIDFRPEVSLDEGLKEFASWCRTHGVCES